MTCGDLAVLRDFIDAISFSDEVLFRRRQALVAELGFDEATIEARGGLLAVDRVAFVGDRFDMKVRGVDPEPAVIIGALDGAERLVDLIAWPIDRPHAMATLAGAVAMLGETAALAHPATVFSPPLRVHRTALTWLRAGCAGCVPLDRLRSAEVFLEIGGSILAEDDAHGAELDDARREIIARGATILVAAA